MSELTVTFVSPSETVWEGAASYVRVPASDGSMGLLPNMAPVLATLSEGVIAVTETNGSTFEMRVSGGFVSVDRSVVQIVASGVQKAAAA